MRVTINRQQRDTMQEHNNVITYLLAEALLLGGAAS